MKMQRSTSFPSNDDVTAITNSSDRRVPPEDPPFSHRFLEKDPETAKARSLYFKIIGPTLVLVFTYVIWGVLPIYWGSLFTLYDHTHNLHGWVVVSIRSVYAPLSSLTLAVAFRISTVERSARRYHKRLLVAPVQ